MAKGRRVDETVKDPATDILGHDARPDRLLTFALGASATFVVAMNVVPTLMSVFRREPLNPWEAGLVIEAWRAALGAEVYEPFPQGHATHFYGFLHPFLLGAIFKLTGPTVFVGRVLALGAACGIGAVVVGRTIKPAFDAWFLVAVAVFIGVNGRSNFYFAEARPDMVAMALCATALVGFARYEQSGAASSLFVGASCLGVAICFKQPSLVVACIPCVAAATGPARRNRRSMFVAFVPMLAAGITVASIRLVDPDVFVSMFERPRAWPIDWNEAAHALWGWSCWASLLVAVWLYARAPVTAARRWLACAMFVSAPASAIADAKFGGAENSWLLTHLASAALLVSLIPALKERLGPIAPQRMRCVRALAASAAFLLLAMPRLWNPLSYHRPHAEARYESALERARSLDGVVLSPEDPTIVLHALGRITESVHFMVDASGPSAGSVLPSRMVDQLNAADHVFDRRRYYMDHIRPEVLERFGFVRSYEDDAFVLFSRPAHDHPRF